jgi:hypothetical protein
MGRKVAFDKGYIIAYYKAGLISGDGSCNIDETRSCFFEIGCPIALRMGENELDKTLGFKFGGEITH